MRSLHHGVHGTPYTSPTGKPLVHGHHWIVSSALTMMVGGNVMPIYLGRLLRENCLIAAGDGGEQCDERMAPVQRITRSARSSTKGATETPNAFAVL